MIKATRNTIPLPEECKVRSLSWIGNDLVDWASGGTVFNMNGGIVPKHNAHPGNWNAAAVSNDGTYAVIYEKTGTKGLVLKNGKHLRELTRDEYRANVYEYPALIFSLPDGKDVLVHCPKEYNRIEIENIETGELLTQRESETQDFFHSRFQISPNGQMLVSSGWIWHPLDWIQIYDIHTALENPEIFDKNQDIAIDGNTWEINAISFMDDEKIVVAKSTWDDGITRALGIYNFIEKQELEMYPFEEELGTLMAFGNLALSLYRYPKLIDLSSGKIIEEWPEINSGTQNSSIIHNLPIPPIAMDHPNRRIAIAEEDQITILSFSEVLK